MTSLSSCDFAQFFREINDNDPFPWQQRLACELFEGGQWPKYLDLPTASGKTSVIEIAVFHLALEALRQSGTRQAPIRIALVVDRRLIVDQAEIRARRLAEALREADTGIMKTAADALRRFAGENDPLMVQALRGGLPRESDWARTPVQPTVLLSTVDQVGSRLLFRGYGVSNRMRPVHAGLLGSDCLIIVDEAHLSEPFRQSLEWVARYRQPPWAEQPPGPWQITMLSATPGSHAGSRFHLKSEDYEHPKLGPRLRVHKPAKLVETKERTSDHKDTAAQVKDFAIKVAQGDIRKVLIVVNRVDLARNVFELLPKEHSAFLLTGRVRELDREKIVSNLEQSLEEFECRESSDPKRLFVVATQCIEVGADYDFDALITQVAPLDALRQRFGRLNRKGRDLQAQAIILARKEDRSKKPDPIYGTKIRETWDWLTQGKREVVDFGVLALRDFEPPEDLESKKADAPIMAPAYLELWTCTNPPPVLEPEVALFLHGVEKPGAEVQIVWRADIHENDLVKAGAWLKRLMQLAPPRSSETLAVPVWAARRWLAGYPDAAKVSDIGNDDRPEETTDGRNVLVWHGADDPQTRVGSPDQIRPGDTLVVPASYGGCDQWGWTGTRPEAHRDWVTDLGLEAAARLKTVDIAVRLHSDLILRLENGTDRWEAISRIVRTYIDEPAQLRESLINSDALPDHWRSELEEILPGSEEITPYPGDRPDMIILTGRRIPRKRGAGEPSTETEGAVARGNAALLSFHTKAVVEQTRKFAEAAGLSDSVRNALVFAASLHDSGKADRRFQMYLHNGAIRDELLAKPRQQRLSRANRELAQLPELWRHEALSVRIAIEQLRTLAPEQEMDRELAIWLIGTHHGWGRPFFPHDDVLDEHRRTIQGIYDGQVDLPPASGPQRADFSWCGLDWAGLFERLQRRYGPWELARLEAVLRLADHRASEDGERD